MTRLKVNKAIRAVAKWKECAELFSTSENIRKAEEMLARLQVVMEGLGAKIPKASRIQTKRTSVLIFGL